MDRSNSNNDKPILGFLGVGLDNEDGHTRLTRTDHFVLCGGSADTHERMQETAIYFNEELKKRGQVLPEISREQAIELLQKALDR